MYSNPQRVRIIMRNLPADKVTDEDIEFFIHRADTIIDAHLEGIYPTPLNPIPSIIMVISTDLAVFFLAESLYSSQRPNLDEHYITRYERSMNMLLDILKGDISIGVDPLPGVSVGYASTNTQQVFNYEEPSPW